MRKLVLGIIFATMHTCCGGVAYAQTYLEKQSVGAYNLLTNPGFENGLAKWTKATECMLGVRPYGSGVRSITCTGVTAAKTLFEQAVWISDYVPYIDDIFKSSIHIVANSPDVQVCMLFNGVEEDCQAVADSASLNAAGYKEVIVSKRLTGLAASFTVGIRVKTVGTTTTAINADAAYVGPWKGVVGLNPNKTDRASYLPGTQGFGTVNPATVASFSWRDGENLELDIKFQAGTSSAVEARVYLPSGLVTKVFPGGGYRIAGPPWIIGAGQAGNVVPLAVSGAPYVVFSLQNASNNGFVPLNGASLNVGNHVNFRASVPIQGWTANTTAQVYGLVPEETVYSADISSTGVISNMVGGNWLSSCTNATTPVCTFTSGWFNGTTPQCWHASTNGYFHTLAATSTTVTGQTRNASDTAIAGARTYFCRRSGADYTRARSTYQNVPLGQSFTYSTSSATQSIPTGAHTAVAFGTLVESSGESWNGTTFTSAKGGLFSIYSAVEFLVGLSWASGNFSVLSVTDTSGNVKMPLDHYTFTATGTYTSAVRLLGSGMVRLSPGESVQIRVFQNSGGARSLSSVPEYNKVTFTRIGF